MMYSNEGKMGEWMMWRGWKESNKFIKYLLLMVGRINDGGKKAEFITHYKTNFLFEKIPALALKCRHHLQP